MPKGDRIKTKPTVKDIKTIDRPKILSERVRRTTVSIINAADSARQSYSEESISLRSPEADVPEKTADVTKTIIGTVFQPASKNKGSIARAKDIQIMNMGAANKAVPVYKSGRERHRTRPYSVKDKAAHTAKPTQKALVAERALKQGKRLAQLKTANKSAISAKTLKKAGVAVMRALRAIVAAVRGLIALIMAGGWVVLVILLIIVIIAALVSSPIGIFFSNDPGAGGMTTREAVEILNDEFSELLLGIEEGNPHDELMVVYTGGSSLIDWKGVLATYVAKVNQNGSDSMDVISFDDEKLDILRGVMWDMNAVSYELINETRERTVIKTGEDGKPEEVVETVTIRRLIITITQKTIDEMAAAYGFTANQRKALIELFDPEFDTLWEELLGGFTQGGGMREPSKDRIPTGPFTWPLEVPGTITSFFGWREDPFTGEIAYHSGVDIGVSAGSPILAAADGIVTIANGTDSYGGGLGYYVRIRHSGGYETLYAHCSAVAVRTGENVRKGQIIGYVGNTGRSKGAHLHWEVYSNGNNIDPTTFFQ